MKLFKKLFLFSLVFVLGFVLLGCQPDTNGENKNEELTEAITELETKLNALQAALENNQAELGSANELVAELRADLVLLNAQLAAGNADVAALEKALQETQKKLDKLSGMSPDEFITEFLLNKRLFEASSFDWTNEEDILDGFEADDSRGVTVYQVEMGTVVKPNFVVEASAELEVGGVTLEYEVEFKNSEYVGFDYFWTSTEDYNEGLSFDKETGELKFNLVGIYRFAFYSLDILPNLNYSAQTIGSWVSKDEVPEKAEGKFAIHYVEVLPGPELLTAEGDNNLEFKVGATNQLTINNPDKYTVVSYKSTNEAVVKVSSSGLATAVAVGKAAVEVVVKDDKGVEKTAVLPVTVFELPEGLLAGGEEGKVYNLKFSSVEQKAKILAHMERYLINSGASIPVINNSGLVIYSERVNFIADNYIAQMGYGPTAVPMDSGTAKGTADDPAYRMWTSGNPSTLNHLQYADSIESDFLSLLNGQLFSFEWRLDDKGRGIGWEPQPEMAKRLAYPVKLVDGKYVEVEDWNGLTQSTLWKFDLRTDLKWQTGEAINADDFIYTFKEVLDGNLAYRRANLWTGGSVPIKGAKAYYDAKGAGEWSDVGIKQVDSHSFVFDFVNNLTQWDVVYNTSGFMYTPVHKATYEQNKSTYGTSMDRFVASGPYKLSYWEKDKEYRFTKNDQYFTWSATDLDVRKPVFENFSYTVVKDNNAALQLFKEGKLDVTSVPASAYDEFKSWPNQKFSPGATSFRLSVNRMTQAELDTKFGKNAWQAKPILQEDDFMWALYYGLDREGVQAITKTSTAWSSYFTNAYSLVSTTEDGTVIETYRETEWGKKVYTGVFEGDFDLGEETLGYNQELSVLFYEAAVQSMIDKGVITEGTVARPTKISVEIAHFDGVTQEAVYAYVVQKYNELFNNTSKFGKRIVFEATSSPQPGVDVYYVKQMTGQFDLALAGISGRTLDPVGFLETFADDNRSGLFLSIGFDSHSPNILIDLDLDGDGELDGAMWWSFDALYSAYNGDTFVKNGVESTAPKAD